MDLIPLSELQRENRPAADLRQSRPGCNMLNSCGQGSQKDNQSEREASQAKRSALMITTLNVTDRALKLS